MQDSMPMGLAPINVYLDVSRRFAYWRCYSNKARWCLHPLTYCLLRRIASTAPQDLDGERDVAKDGAVYSLYCFILAVSVEMCKILVETSLKSVACRRSARFVTPD